MRSLWQRDRSAKAPDRPRAYPRAQGARRGRATEVQALTVLRLIQSDPRILAGSVLNLGLLAYVLRVDRRARSPLRDFVERATNSGGR
jgi:hypothetical protein